MGNFYIASCMYSLTVLQTFVHVHILCGFVLVFLNRWLCGKATVFYCLFTKNNSICAISKEFHSRLLLWQRNLYLGHPFRSEKHMAAKYLKNLERILLPSSFSSLGFHFASKSRVDKGQLISKGLFDVIVWTKKPTKFFKEFLP